MSNQEPQGQNNTTEKTAVNKKRRFILGAGAVAPVALTLASPSVFGVGCLSQQMSGNTSIQGNGSCTQGDGPQTWLFNTNWPSPFAYGTKNANRGTNNGNGGTNNGNGGTNNGNGNNISYTGGTPFSDAFPGDITTQMVEILHNYNKNNPSANETISAYFVAARLNAQRGGYVLTPKEVIALRSAYRNGLCNTNNPLCLLPPGYQSVEQFLLSTFSSS